MSEFLDQYPYLLPLVIFFGRILDVSLGTLRIIFVSKGERYKAPLIGFVEVFIWIVVISEVLSRANDLLSYVSYAGGYAAGTYIGIMIENKIAIGYLVCKIYTNTEPSELIKKLNLKGYGTTLVEGMGSKKKVYIIEVVMERKSLSFIDNLIADFDKETFYTVEDIRLHKKGVFHKRTKINRRRFSRHGK